MKEAAVAAAEAMGPAAETLLATLWRASWQAALIALVLLVLQWLLRDRLAARWRHALWLLVFARLAMPVLPASPTSAFNLVDASTLAGRARDSHAAGRSPMSRATTTTATTAAPSSPSPSTTESTTEQSSAKQSTPPAPRPAPQSQPPEQPAAGADGGATERSKLADPIQGPAAPRTSGPVDPKSTDRAAADVAGSGAQPPAVP